MEVSLKLNFNPALDVGKLNILVRELKAALGPLGKDIKLLDAAKIKAEFDKVASEAVEATTELTHLQKQIDEIRKRSQSMPDLPRSFKFNELYQGVQNVSNALGGFLNTGVRFESDLAAVGAITGKSGKELDFLGEKARELGKEFGGGAGPQLAAFTGILSKLGPQMADDSNALALMSRNVNILSKASGDTADVSMAAITDSMLQFGLVTGDAAKDAETSTRVINAMAAGAQVGAAEIPQVKDAILQAGSAASSANQSLEQVNAAIQVMARGGKVGAEAGIAYRNMLGLIQNASGPAEEAMNKVGTSSAELGKILNEEGFDKAMARLKQGLESVESPAERNAALFKIFGTENAAAATSFIANLGYYEEFFDGIIAGEQGMGTAFEQAQQRMDNAQGKIDRVMAWFEDKGITIFKTFGSNVSAAMVSITQIAPQLTALSGLKNLFPASMAGNIGAFAKSLLVTLLPALFTTNAATGTVTFSFAAMWTAITGPVGIIIAAIAAIGAGLYLLYKNVEPIRTAVDSVVAFIIPVFEQIWEVLKMVGEVIWEVGKLVFEWFITPWKIAYEIIVAILAPVWEAITAFFAIGNGAKAAGGAMELFNKAIRFVQRSLLAMKAGVRGTIFALAEIKNVILDVFKAISKLTLKDIAVGIVTGDFGELSKVLGDAGRRVGSAFTAGAEDAMKIEPYVEGGGGGAPTGGGKPKPPPKGFPVIDEKAAEKAKKIQDEVKKMLAESQERITKDQAEAEKVRADRTLDETIRAQEKIEKDVALKALDRMAMWTDLERERVRKASALAEQSLAEEQRQAIKAVDDKIAAVEAKEDFSEQQKTTLREQYTKERSLVEQQFAEKTAQALADIDRESQERKLEFARGEDEKRLSALQRRLDKENKAVEAALARQLKIQQKINDVFEGVAVKSFERIAADRIASVDAEEDRELELVGENAAAKEQIERSYADRRAKIEEELANRKTAVAAVKSGSNLFADNQQLISQLSKQKEQIEEQLAILPPDSLAAIQLRQQLEDIEDTLAEKQDTIGVLIEGIEADFSAGMAGLFSGDSDAMKDGMRQTLGTIAGFLQNLASAAVIELVLSSPSIKALAAAAGPLAPLVLAGIAATIRGGINALLSPILSSILSFGTGGRVDDPTLAVVGDAAKYTGSNTEWILRDRDIQDIVYMATTPMTEAIVTELKQLSAEVRILQAEKTLVRGRDIVTVSARESSGRRRRQRS
jgi:TP901 family phage tail tape measure protein